MEPIDRLSPALAPLWQAVHTRLSSGLPVSRVRVGPLDAGQQAAVADLLGSERLPGAYPEITLSRLDQAIREVTGLGTSDVVAKLVGPLGNRADDRRRAAAHTRG